MKFNELQDGKKVKLIIDVCSALFDAGVLDNEDFNQDFSQLFKSFLLDMLDSLEDEMIVQLINSYSEVANNISKRFNHG